MVLPSQGTRGKVQVSETGRDNGANGVEVDASPGQGRPARTLVIGLSGCSWNVLEPVLETGAAPFLATLIENGTSAALESSLPYQTGAAWASFATGCLPGSHGMHDTLVPEPQRGFRYLHARDLRRPTYYQQLGWEGKRSVLRQPAARSERLRRGHHRQQPPDDR